MSGSGFVFVCLLHVLILRWCWSSQACWVTVTLEDQACLRSEDSYPVIYLRLDSHQVGSFLSSSSPDPSHKRTLSTLQRASWSSRRTTRGATTLGRGPCTHKDNGLPRRAAPCWAPIWWVPSKTPRCPHTPSAF
ncbi:hypothetical protein ATANTOWER_018593 [Ataeniobius toweri]|uniref:Secreted protein n=1 Tax=Ataeniobius toweri TaxID=208326 RepID=A0ABU7AG47_9TELE|nr:hypothetical protein [Ataeniobius toweri]